MVNVAKYGSPGEIWFFALIVCTLSLPHNTQTIKKCISFIASIGQFRKKKCVFTVCQLTLILGPDPKLFYGTFSRELFKYHILPGSNVVFYV